MSISIFSIFFLFHSFFSCFSFSHFTIYFCLFYWDQFQTFLIYAFKGLNVTLHEYMLSHFSHVWLCDPLNCSPPCSSVHEHGHSRQECWTGLPCLLPEVFPIQGLNLCLLHLLHWKQILYCWATGEAPNVTLHIALCASKFFLVFK